MKSLSTIIILFIIVFSEILSKHSHHHTLTNSSKILPTSFAKISLSQVTHNHFKVPEFVTPKTLGPKEYKHVMKVMNVLKNKRNRYRDVEFYMPSKIKPLNDFLQKSIQKATTENI